jgi:hypothetical protein
MAFKALVPIKWERGTSKMMQFEGGFQRTYSTTVTRAVGPTTLVGAREPLPQPTPTDANAIWLAKNGNDANAGTMALPKVTVAGAIAALTAGKPTVHIFRNGYVGDLLFNNGTTTIILPVSRWLQVELGEIATIQAPTTTVATLHLMGFCQINGIRIESNSTGIACFGSLNRIENCDVNSTTTNVAFAVINLTNDTIFRRNIVSGMVSLLTTSAPIASLTFVGSIFRGITNPLNPNSLPSWFQMSTISNNATITINNCIVFGCSSLVYRLPSTSSYLFHFTSCHIFAVDTLLADDLVLAPAFTAEFRYSLRGYVNNYRIIASGAAAVYPSSYTLLITNDIPQGTSPVYTDQRAGSEGDPEGLRLQWKGKATSLGGRYFLDSPLIGAGLGGVDVNPWVENTIFTGTSFAPPVPVIWPPSGYKPVVAKPQNPIEQRDVRGGPHGSFDRILREWELSWGDGSNYANNMDLWRWIQLLNDTGAKRWYPRGIGQSIFTDPIGTILGTSGSLVGNIFTPTIPSGVPMVPFHHVGDWIMLVVGGFDRHFLISANDSVTFTLERKFFDAGGALPPNGPYVFRMEYVLVKFAIQDLAAAQEYFTAFLKGGAWGEHGTLALSRANTTEHELKGYSMRLLEAIDPQEAE